MEPVRFRRGSELRCCRLVWEDKNMKAGKKADIVIRADGNADIGAGHLMRCLTVAEQIGERGHVVFWCADETSAAQVRARGYEVQVLGTDYRDMLSELPRLRRMAPSVSRVILVDSYFVTAEYLQALRAYGSVYLLEDVPGRIWPVDGVINYNAFADMRFYQEIYGQSSGGGCKPAEGQDTKLYVGASYVPLRPQFAGWEYRVQSRVKELLVTTGGGDRDNIAGKILERIEDMACQIHVVSGPYNPHGAWLDGYVGSHPHVTLHRQVEEMAKLMTQCDLAVTAGGTTVYELCALGVPFVCFSYAENQEALAEYAGRQEIGLYAGKYHQDAEETLTRIGELVRQAAADPQLRGQISRRARELVDGRGAGRLANALLKPEIRNLTAAPKIGCL